MTFTPVCHDDDAAVERLCAIVEASNAVDDPWRRTYRPETARVWLRYGWDLDTGTSLLYTPAGSDEPVGVLHVELPHRSNRHLAYVSGQVAPSARTRGHGWAMLAEAIRRAGAAGRTTLRVTTGADNAYATSFLEHRGFVAASQDARRRQVLADIDRAEVDRQEARAREAAADYRLERLRPPLSDDVLAGLTQVSAAIEDAPMGELVNEPDVHDLDQLQREDRAGEGRRDRVYRVVARHRETGEAAGHTRVLVSPFDPTRGFQADTAVSRTHRGHRLGLLLKIDMMRWLAECEPQLTYIDTSNQITNRYMIDVNEAIGYRWIRTSTTFQRTLGAD